MAKRKNRKKKRNRGKKGSSSESSAPNESAVASASDSRSDASEDVSSSSGPAAAEASSPPEKKQAQKQPEQETQKSSAPPAHLAPDDGLSGWWLEWAYKGKRGLWVRWVSVGVFFFLVVFGLHNMHVMFSAWALDDLDSWFGWWGTILAKIPLTMFDEEFHITVGLLVTIALGLAGGAGLVWLFWKKPDVSEFMIDCENEMYKVSWPSQQELKGSTIATVVAVVLLGLYLFFVDLVLARVIEMFIRVDSY